MEKANNQRIIEEQIAQTMDNIVVGNQILRLLPNSTPDFMNIRIDFRSFCLVNIVEKDLLMFGKRNLGSRLKNISGT